jgi:hypothetical protein
VLMPLLFGTAGAIIGVAGVFWIVGAAVATGARTAWLLKDSLSAPPRDPNDSHKP